MPIVGYDDIDFAAVPLTSVRWPAAAMGGLAAELLLGEADGGENHEHRRVGPTA